MTVPPPPTPRAEQSGGLYRQVLGGHWHRLHPAVRRAHADPRAELVRASGWFTIGHGRSALARLLLHLLPLPSAAARQWVELAVLPHPLGERWIRTFGQQRIVSVQRPGPPGVLLEALGPLLYRFRLRAADGGIRYQHLGCALRLGRRTLPLPHWLAPHVEARERPARRRGPAAEVVEVRVSVPLAGLLLRYEGELRIEEPEP